MKRVAHRSLALLFSFLILAIPTTQAAFTDLETGASDSIDYLEEKGVVQGYENGEVKADQPVTTAEWFTMLLRNYGFDPSTITTFTHPFESVDNTAWYAPFVEKAWQLGLLEGVSDFDPAKPVRRLKAAELMLNFLGLPIPQWVDEDQWAETYTDVGAESWLAPIVFQANRYGLIDAVNSEGNTDFRPFQALTRGEAADWLLNMDTFVYGENVVDAGTVVEDLIESQDDSATDTLTEIPHLDIFLDVWTRIHEEFYGRDDLDDEQLIYEAIQGMIDSLGDPYSEFYDPPEAEVFTNYLEGQLSGIGAQLVEEESKVTIQNFLEGSPAENSGLHVNDQIVEVDELDVRGMSAEEMIQYIRGEAGTTVTLGVEREGVDEVLYFPIVREVIDVAYLSGEVLEGDMLYVDINLFDSLSFIDFTQTVKGLMEEAPDFKGFILDVRDNPGGYLSSVHSIIGHFVPKNHTVFYVRTSESESYMYVSSGEGEFADYPVVILVNENSASASEILASVLKEKEGAVLVGKTTYGKGTVQQIIDYGDGSTLKLTIAEWRSPKYHSFNEIGISPHYDVDLTSEDIANGIDPQLDKAIEVLREMINEQAVDDASSES